MTPHAPATPRRGTQPNIDVAHAILDLVPFAMMLVDGDGVIHASNPAASRLFGFAESEMIGRSVGTLLPQLHRDLRDATIADYAADCSAQRAALRKPLIACHRDGHEMPVEVLVGETRLDGRRVFGCFVHDGTAALVPEVPIAESPSLTSLIATTSNLVHDLNQPLTAMINFLAAAQMALGTHAEAAQVADFVADATAQSLRARSIVRRLREVLAT